MQDELIISNLPPGHNLTTSMVEVNMPAPIVTPGSPLVKVVIKYPVDWKKQRFFKDGDIKEVSPEAADTFIEIGIATLFNPDALVAEEAERSEEQLNATLADHSVLDGPVIGYENMEEQTETKKGAKKTAGK